MSYTSLIERLQRGEGGDRELDGDIAELLESAPPQGLKRMPILERWTAPRYTGSLDAAIALVAEKLPGWSRELSYEPAVRRGAIGNRQRSRFHPGKLCRRSGCDSCR